MLSTWITVSKRESLSEINLLTAEEIQVWITYKDVSDMIMCKGCFCAQVGQLDIECFHSLKTST